MVRGSFIELGQLLNLYTSPGRLTRRTGRQVHGGQRVNLSDMLRINLEQLSCSSNFRFIQPITNHSQTHISEFSVNIWMPPLPQHFCTVHEHLHHLLSFVCIKAYFSSTPIQYTGHLCTDTMDIWHLWRAVTDFKTLIREGVYPASPKSMCVNVKSTEPTWILWSKHLHL